MVTEWFTLDNRNIQALDNEVESSFTPISMLVLDVGLTAGTCTPIVENY